MLLLFFTSPKTGLVSLCSPPSLCEFSFFVMFLPLSQGLVKVGFTVFSFSHLNFVILPQIVFECI